MKPGDLVMTEHAFINEQPVLWHLNRIRNRDLSKHEVLLLVCKIEERQFLDHWLCVTGNMEVNLVHSWYLKVIE